MVATVLVVAACVVVVIGPVDEVVVVAGAAVDEVVVVAGAAVVDVVVAPGFFKDGTQSSIRRSNCISWLPNWSVANAVRGVNFTPAFRVL